MPHPLTINVRTSKAIDPDRIRQVIPLEDRECQVIYVADDGRYATGTVACSAEDLLVAIGGATPR